MAFLSVKTYGNSAAYFNQAGGAAQTGPTAWMTGISNLNGTSNLNSKGVMFKYGAFNNSTALLKAFVALIGKMPALVPYNTTTAEGPITGLAARYPYGN